MDGRSLFFWALYALFAFCALFFNWHDDMLALDGPHPAVKLTIWVLLFGFLAYSFYCSTRENLFVTIRRVAALHWGRQIGADLYLGLFLALFVVYLNEGVLAVLLWALPTLAFANLSILLYFAIHFEAIVGKLLT